MKQIGPAIRHVMQLAALGIAGVMVAAMLVVNSESVKAPWGLQWRWLDLSAFTILVFGLVVSSFRRSWGRPTFWLAIVGLLALHGAAYIVVLRAVEDWRPVWFFVASVAEATGLMLVLHALGYVHRPVAPRGRKRRVPGEARNGSKSES